MKEDSILLDGQIRIEYPINLSIDNQSFDIQKINENNFYVISTYFNNSNIEELIREIIKKTKDMEIICGLIELNRQEEEKLIMSYNRMNLKWDIIKGKTL